MERAPDVSVILPTYNRAGTLGRAIASVLAQTHADLELLVIDDGSTDGTAELVRQIRDPRVRYLPQANAGVSAARNAGLHAARGAWVAFQDSDDEWRVEKLARQRRAADEAGGPVLVVCGDIVVNHYAMSYLGVDSPEPVVDIDALALRRLPPAPTWLAPRDEILAVGGFDARIDCFEDWELSLRLGERGVRMRMVNEPLLLRQRTPGSLFSNEARFAPNLERILGRHGARLKADPSAWAFYCNLIGQTLAQFGECGRARPWFRQAISAAPRSPRSWLNLAVSYAGPGAFRNYVSLGRSLRARVAPPIRPSAEGA